MSMGAAARPSDAEEALQVRLEIADDLFRVGLSRLLNEEGIEVVSDGPVHAVLVDRADDAADERVIVLCESEDAEAVSALADGAAAVVWRGSEPAMIAAAVRAAVAGIVAMPARTASRMLSAGRDQPASEMRGRQMMESLSVRELEVLSLVASGLANEEIAAELVVTPSTVKNHLARIMAKLGARNRTHAAVIATRLTA